MNKNLTALVLPLLLSACSGGGSRATGVPYVSKSSGQSSVTFEGVNFSRTTRYGVEPNTSVYCSRYKSGETSISLSEKGENRNNSGWLKDGLSFSFYRSIRPQDTDVIGTSDTSVFAVVKEMPTGGTFNLSNLSKCTFGAQASGEDLDVRFDCPSLEREGMRLRVYGWLKCKVAEQNF